MLLRDVALYDSRLMLDVWLAGLQINCSVSKTSQCHRVLELAPATAALGYFHF